MSVGWQEGGGFSQPGIGEREIPWPSHGATGPFGTANPTCGKCGGRIRGAKKCSCEQPDWRVKGERVDVSRWSGGGTTKAHAEVSLTRSGLFGGRNPTCATCGGRMHGAVRCDCESPDWRVNGEKVEVPVDAPAEGDLPEPMHEAEDLLLYLGDSIEVMAAMPPNSVDAIVTDPPYGLEFMGNEWDSFRVDERAPRWAGERSGSAGAEIHDEGSNRPGGARVAFGGKRATTARCTGCGKRDAFRNPHECVEGAEWAPEFVNSSGAPSSMLAFQEWTRRWSEQALRVLKPGGYIVSFSGTRTYHRMASGMEDGGFEIRDQIHWVYGTGFPKSLNVALAIDDELGVEHVTEKRVVFVEASLLDEGGEVEVDATRTSGIGTAFDAENGTWAQGKAQEFPVKRAGSDEGKEWEGWGTALKPGHEPIALARKPFAVTVARNVLEHGTGGLNIDGSLVGDSKDVPSSASQVLNHVYGDLSNRHEGTQGFDPEVGRWPANVILSHSAECEPFASALVRGDGHWPGARGAGGISTSGHGGQGELAERQADDEVELYRCAPDCPVLAIDAQAGVSEARRFGIGGGGPSRFFYVAKPSPGEKDAGLDPAEFPPLKQEDPTHPPDGAGAQNPRNRSAKPRLNNHPTVKPIDLMRHLIRLVCRPGGTVLDPFVGSGTTGCAAVLEGMRFVGVDLDERNVRMARARCDHWRSTMAQAALF